MSMEPEGTRLAAISKRLENFVAERDWSQFHSPKNLAMALTGEVGELVEHFQWLTEEQSRQLGEKELAAVREELADVQIYLLLARKLDVDLLGAVEDKLAKNAEKYPVHRARGNSKKYTEL